MYSFNLHSGEKNTQLVLEGQCLLPGFKRMFSPSYLIPHAALKSIYGVMESQPASFGRGLGDRGTALWLILEMYCPTEPSQQEEGVISTLSLQRKDQRYFHVSYCHVFVLLLSYSENPMPVRSQKLSFKTRWYSKLFYFFQSCSHMHQFFKVLFHIFQVFCIFPQFI